MGHVPRPPATAITADVPSTRAQLQRIRPSLIAGFDRETPGAYAAVLARLLGALDREPLPGLRSRTPGEVTFGNGVTVSFPKEAGQPFAPGDPGLTAHVGEQPVTDPAQLARILWGAGPFATEIANSAANLALARAARAAHGDRAAAGLAEAEQLVTDGHPLHPCCRTRGGMSVADVLAYAPEHFPTIRLRRLKVPRDRWYGNGEPVLLAHPWQADRLRDRHPWLTADGETGPARPLMSLRTVAPLDGGPHVKTAVDVQMTSAVRTVSPAAVHNGPRLSRLLKTLTRDLPIDVLAELEAGAVIVGGEPQRHLAYLTREAPALAPDEVVLPAAALSTLRPPDPETLVRDLAAKLFAPAVILLDRGVALEAHGQNTLVVLKNGRVDRILYRDLGGVRVSPARLRAHGIDPPHLHGDLPTDDPRVLRTKLAAAALGTVAAELITTLSAGAAPGRLWGMIAAAIKDTGTADVPFLLNDPLPVKATTAMRLAADPLDDLWASMDNPMAEHA